jgi:hypothetical protein
MSHLSNSINGASPDSEGALSLSASSMISQSPSSGQHLGLDAGNVEPIAVSGNRLKAYLHGGAPTTSSSVNLVVPLTGSSYPYFLELGPLKTSNIPRLSSYVTSGFSWIYNTYGGGATTYVNGVSISGAGTYRLSLDWCVGSLSSSGSYVDVQWQTGEGAALGPITRIGRSNEKRNSCVGYVEVSTTATVGLYVHAISGAKYNLDNFLDIFASVEKMK